MAPRKQSRREFIALLGGSATALLGCGIGEGSTLSTSVVARGSARLLARPSASPTGIAPGTYQVTTGAPRDGSLVVPSSYGAQPPMPLVLALHGAGGTAAQATALLGSLAESRGFLLLAIGSRGVTWDGISSQFGRDVAFIDGALKWVFGQCAVDPAKIVVEGFSDGASYALAIALANGDLFTRAIAFSPGYVPDSESAPTGKPAFFLSHGRQDTVLPIDQASRRIVPSLTARGYDVVYTEFDGGHTVPDSVKITAVDWLLRT